jgi:hypothetical protein
MMKAMMASECATIQAVEPNAAVPCSDFSSENGRIAGYSTSSKPATVKQALVSRTRAVLIGASTGYMQDGVGVDARALKQLDRLRRFDRSDLYSTTLCFLEHLRHHGQRSLLTSADDKVRALPRNFLFDRKRSMAELIAEALRGLLLTQLHLAAIDNDVLFVGFPVDANGAEREMVDLHDYPPFPV